MWSGTSSAFYVTLFSVGNCLGRVVAAGGSDVVAERLPRPFALTLTAALFCALLALAAIGGHSCLYVVAGGAGISIGAINGLEPVLIADMFGVKYFGVNYSALAIPVFLSSLTLGQYLPGIVYDMHVIPGTHNCYGSHCFRTSFLILAAFCASGVGAAAVLTLRIMRAAAQKKLVDAKAAPLNAPLV